MSSSALNPAVGNVIPIPRRPAPAGPPTENDALASITPMATSCAVYTVAEVAHLLSLSRGSAYHLVRTGEIPARKMGGRWVIPKRRFHAWLDGLPEASIEDVERELAKLDRSS